MHSSGSAPPVAGSPAASVPVIDVPRQARASLGSVARVDTAPAGPAPRSATPPGVLPLPRPRSAPDSPGALGAARLMSDNVAVDFGQIAALMMEIDSELARAARDSQVAQIEVVAAQMHGAADELRSSAKLALAAGCVSGAAQIASAGITLGGGVKGMTLTAEPTAPSGGALAASESAPGAESSSPSVSPAEAAVSETPGARVAPLAGDPASQPPSSESGGSSVAGDSRGYQADLAASQRLSARAQNIALVTQGFSQVASATGEIMKSALDYESRTAEARSKEGEARAERDRAYLERAKGFADAMQKGVQDLISAYDQMIRAAHETASRVWSRA